MLEKKHGKSFVAEHSHLLFAIIWVILHPGPLRCAGEYTLHYLDGQSLRNPCVFGPAEEGSSKNNTGRMCDLFIFFPVTSVQPYRYVYFKITAAKGINVRTPHPRGFCSIGFPPEVPYIPPLRFCCSGLVDGQGDNYPWKCCQKCWFW